jgi:Ca2+-binding RTX toxin-like protein
MPVYRLGNGDDSFDSASTSDWTNDSRVFGGNGDDAIIARALSPTATSRLLVSGGNGDDSILLDASNSEAIGGNGDDELTSIGGLGNALRGGNGDDLLVSFGGGSGMGLGNTLTGGLGEDAFRFTNAGNLVVTKDAGDDRSVSDGDVFLDRRTPSPITVSGNSSNCAPSTAPMTCRPTRGSRPWP